MKKIKKYIKKFFQNILNFFRKLFGYQKKGYRLSEGGMEKKTEKKTTNQTTSPTLVISKIKSTKKKLRKTVVRTIAPFRPPTDVPIITEIFEPALYIGNYHWKLFASLIKRAKKEVKIVTNSVSHTALYNICSNLNEEVEVKIITGRGKGYEYIFNLIDKDNIKRCRNLHAKFCIIDNNIMLAGSSNITIGSLGNHTGKEGFFEADLLIKDRDIINSARNLFNILWNEESDISPLKNNSGFLSSAYGIPLKLKDFILKANKSLTIIVPPIFPMSTNLITIPKYIRELNSKIQLTFMTSYRVREIHLDGLYEIKSLNNTDLILVDNPIHAKIYLIDDEIALISTVNLTFSSWISSLESGVLIDDKEKLIQIKNWIEDLKTNQMPLHPIISKGGDDGPNVPTDEFLQKINFKFTPEGTNIIDELKRISVRPLDFPKPIDKTVKVVKKKHKLKQTTVKKPESLKPLPELFEHKELEDNQKEELIEMRDKFLSQLLKNPDEIEKKNELKKQIININLKLSKLQKSNELTAQSKEILIQTLLDYVLVCPFTETSDIIWYLADFATENNIILNTMLLFEVFTLSFYTEHTIKTAGYIFKVFSVIDEDFKFQFIDSIINLFKNMILGRGSSGVEIKNSTEFQQVSKEFFESFGIPAPLPEEIISAIFNHELSMNRITTYKVYKERIIEIFPDIKIEIEKKIQEIHQKIKVHLKVVIGYLTVARDYINNNSYLESCITSNKAAYLALTRYLYFIDKFSREIKDKSVEKIYEIAFGEELEYFLSKFFPSPPKNEIKINKTDAIRAYKTSKSIYKKIKEALGI